MATEVVWNANVLKQVSLGSLEIIADNIADAARAVAPVDQRDYVDGIEVETGDDEQGNPVARVNANDWKSHGIEFGTVDTPKFAPLRRGLDSQGG